MCSPPVTRRAQFLSTLSLRRATLKAPFGIQSLFNFYPRSPCGERPQILGLATGDYYISIHALLAESDAAIVSRSSMSCQFLSTLSLRRATLADCTKIYAVGDFYPRSPCGERLLPQPTPRPLPNFYPRSPCGERPQRTPRRTPQQTPRFLSTLSLRRATTS